MATGFSLHPVIKLESTTLGSSCIFNYKILVVIKQDFHIRDIGKVDVVAFAGNQRAVFGNGNGSSGGRSPLGNICFVGKIPDYAVFCG